MIDQYTTGSHMTVNGNKYQQDLKIIRGEVKGNWWRGEGHRLDINDIQDILSAGPEVFVIGTGYAGNPLVYTRGWTSADTGWTSAFIYMWIEIR